MEEENSKQDNIDDVATKGEVVEEEYVLMDLDAVTDLIDIPQNAPYVLSGLDTMNPILVIDNKFRLVGEYEETIGTCLVFSEEDSSSTVPEGNGASEANVPAGNCTTDSNQALTKQVKPVASLHKILKFRLLADNDGFDTSATMNKTSL